MPRSRTRFELVLRRSFGVLFIMVMLRSLCEASPLSDRSVLVSSIAAAGYDGIPVQQVINGDLVEVVGTIPAPRAKRTPSANRYAECTNRQAECRNAQVRFPSGYALDYQSRPQYWAREKGSATWIELVNPRAMGRVDSSGHYQSIADVRPGEYDEFPGFALQAVSISGNCAVVDRDVSQWEFVNIREGVEVEFRIVLHVKDCGKMKNETDTSD